MIYGFLQKVLRLFETFLGITIHRREPAQIKVIRVKVPELPFCAANFCLLYSRGNRANHANSHLILKVENVFEWAIKSICPYVRPGLSVDQLACYADAISCFAKAAFKHVPHAKLAANIS